MAILSSVSFYPCSDIERTTRFYCDILGLKLYQDQGSCRIFDTGYGYWGFCQYQDRTPNPKGLCLLLNCENEADVDVFYERLKDKCRILAPPAKHPKFPVYSFFVEDPDGYNVEFQKIADE